MDIYQAGKVWWKTLLSSNMGNVESSVLEAWPLLRTTSQGSLALILIVPFLVCILWDLQIFGSTLLNSQSAPLKATKSQQKTKSITRPMPQPLLPLLNVFGVCLPRSWNNHFPKHCSTAPPSWGWGCCPGHGSHWQIPAGWRDPSPSRPLSGLAPDLL